MVMISWFAFHSCLEFADAVYMRRYDSKNPPEPFGQAGAGVKTVLALTGQAMGL